LELTERQRMLLEHLAYGLEIELGGEVEHGEIFVIERLDGLRLVMAAMHQVVVRLAMRIDMASDVHAHEYGESRIEAAERARIARRHARQQVLLQPLDRPGRGKLVDLVGLTRGSIGPAIRVMLRGWAMQEWIAAAQAEPEEDEELDVEF
jgi:hypothetical protein